MYLFPMKLSLHAGKGWSQWDPDWTLIEKWPRGKRWQYKGALKLSESWAH